MSKDQSCKNINYVHLFILRKVFSIEDADPKQNQKDIEQCVEWQTITSKTISEGSC